MGIALRVIQALRQPPGRHPIQKISRAARVVRNHVLLDRKIERMPEVDSCAENRHYYYEKNDFKANVHEYFSEY